MPQSSTIRASKFDNSLVLYRLTDSLGVDSVLVYSIDSTQQLYQASFSYVGKNKGDYILEQNNANGRVFRWLPPVAGVPQGSYAPLRQLVAPTQLQLVTIKAEGNLAADHHLKVELATSKNDINLFSDFDKENDRGAAGRLDYRWDKKIAAGTFSTSLHYEFNDDQFTTIERVRNVEFSRDWNLQPGYNEGLQLGGIGLALMRDSSNISYQADVLSLNHYRGLRNTARAGMRTHHNISQVQASWLTTTDSVGSTNFLRESGYFTHYLVPHIWAGISVRRRMESATESGHRYFKALQLQLSAIPALYRFRGYCAKFHRNQLSPAL